MTEEHKTSSSQLERWCCICSMYIEIDEATGERKLVGIEQVRT